MPEGNGFEAKAVFNPGVIKKDGIVYMLYRGVGDLSSYASSLGLAVSEDNISFKKVFTEPVFSPHGEHAKGGVEDPRIVEIDGVFFITYVAVPQAVLENGVPPENREKPLITSGALLITTDFKHFTDKGIITPYNSDNKDIVIFPERINGKYAMLHRPYFWSKTGIESSEAKAYKIDLPCGKEELPEKPSIWLSYYDNFHAWTRHVVLNGLQEENDDKVGPGLPPLKTPKGWLLIYHHVEIADSGKIYSAKAALLDFNDPSKVIARLPYDILRPEAPYEKEGFINNVVFPTGGFIENDILYVYYGAADTSIGLATGSISELLRELEQHTL